MNLILKFSRRFLIVFFVIITIIAFFISSRENIHAIRRHGNAKAPLVYRSAQLTPAKFKRFVKEKNIDVVLNLRGESKSKWYVNEAKAAKELDIQYYTYGFSAYRPPDRERFLKILDVLDKVKREKKTLLIHCKAGADRTGLMSAVVQNYIYDMPVEAAKKDSLSFYYGHWVKPHGVLELVLDRYKPYEKQMSFREWIETKYDRQAILDYYEDHRLKLPYDIRL